MEINIQTPMGFQEKKPSLQSSKKISRKKKCVQLGIKKECFEDPKQTAPQKGGNGTGTFSYPVTLPTQMLQ